MRTEAFPWLLEFQTPLAVPPAWLFYAGAVAVLCFGIRRWYRAQQVTLVLVPLLGLAHLAGLHPEAGYAVSLAGFELVPLRIDRLSQLFGLLFHVGALMGGIYALGVRDTLQHAAALIYGGSALGAVFAGDLMSLLFYWEAMAVTSALLVWARRDGTAQSAGLRYLTLHLLSGLLLLAGVVVHYGASGSLAFDRIGTAGAAGWLMLLAFGIKCGFPLAHNWITDGYPASTPSGTVFLSIFTTKAAVYALARGFAGTEVLIWVGTVMAVFPIFYAVIENDLRRVLGYSMINQIGFMVVGVGIGTELALNGTVAHAFNEVLFKGLLFMTMGVVVLRVGHARGSDLGGLYRSMPWTTVCCVVGAASISAFPLFSGFVSKSMIMTALFEHGASWAWLALLFASAGVFHHAGIKIPYFAFFGHDPGLRTREAPASMLVAMTAAAVGCVAIGSFPGMLYALLPWPVDYHPYTYSHVLLQIQLLAFSALAFGWLKVSGAYPPELRSTNLDAEWVYRRGIPDLHGRAAVPLGAAAATARASLRAAGRDIGAVLAGMGRLLDGPFRVGTAALWAGTALCGYLIMLLFGR